MAERFDHYMERCLYDPEDGFYTSGAGSAGRRSGDFITSPEVGPLFGEIVGAALDAWWLELGRPDPFIIVDAGSGPGTLARSLAMADGPSATSREILSVDRSTELETMPPVADSPPSGTPRSGVMDDTAGMPDDLDNAVIIANELLDNLPFRILERTRQGWAELYVATVAGVPTEELRPVAGPLPAPLDRTPALTADLEPGDRVPVLQRAAGWVEAVRQRRPAVLLTFDYGAATTAELARRGGWLRTFRRHARGDDPLLQPGEWDITTDVAIDQLPAPDEVLNQADFLRRWGIEALVDEGRRYWAEHASAPDLHAMRMRSRVTEAEALTDPAGLGGWLVCCWADTTGSRGS